MDKQEQWEKEFRFNCCAHIDFSEPEHEWYDSQYETEWTIYFTACMARTEEQRLKNEKALEAFAYIEKLLPLRYQRDFDKELETIKAALGSV